MPRNINRRTGQNMPVTPRNPLYPNRWYDSPIIERGAADFVPDFSTARTFMGVPVPLLAGSAWVSSAIVPFYLTPEERGQWESLEANSDDGWNRMQELQNAANARWIKAVEAFEAANPGVDFVSIRRRFRGGA